MRGSELGRGVLGGGNSVRGVVLLISWLSDSDGIAVGSSVSIACMIGNITKSG